MTVWTAAVACSISSGITVVSFSFNAGRAVSVTLCNAAEALLKMAAVAKTGSRVGRVVLCGPSPRTGVRWTRFPGKTGSRVGRVVMGIGFPKNGVI